MRNKEETYYVITYRKPVEGKIDTLKAKTVRDSSLGLSFVAISDFIFDTDSLVVNPEEERRQQTFKNVKTLHLSIYTIVSIEEVGQDNEGLQFEKDKSNLVVFPRNDTNPSGEDQ